MQTEGGNLSFNLAIWRDGSEATALLRTEGLWLMQTLPTASVEEAVECLRDIRNSYFHAPALMPAPPSRLTASAGPVQHRPPLQIQG